MMHQKRNTIIKSVIKDINDNIISALEHYDIEITLDDFSLSPPKQESFGDLSSNISLLISRRMKQNPLAIAEKIKAELLNNNIKNIDSITVTPPGFINFVIKKDFYQNNLKSIIQDKDNFGKDFKGKGKSANVEFVSANPTGPLTVGHGRNAVIGDTVSNILEWHEYKVTREYYYNDAGKQMRTLGKSVEARYLELLEKSFEFPEDGYQGDYIIEIAKEIINNDGKDLKEDKEFFTTASRVLTNRIKTSETFLDGRVSNKSLNQIMLTYGFVGQNTNYKSSPRSHA